jgi:GntR family transcriptional regulator
MHTIEQTVLRGLSLQKNGVPIYVQIREQLLQAISSGLLEPGARMPTMRQVAVALKVDLNTVRHAYDDLQRDGIIMLKQGLGSFVAATAPPAMSLPISPAPGATPSLDPAEIDDLARRAIALAAGAGVDPLVLAARIAGLISSKENLS